MIVFLHNLLSRAKKACSNICLTLGQSFKYVPDLVLRVDGHPEGVDAQGELCDVKPLAVDVIVVDVLASGRDSLVAVILAVVLRVHAGAVIVLQAEGGLVTLSHSHAVRVEQVKMSKDLWETNTAYSLGG